MDKKLIFSHLALMASIKQFYNDLLFITFLGMKAEEILSCVKQERDVWDHTAALNYLLFAQYLLIIRDSWQVQMAWRDERQSGLNKIMRLYEQIDLDMYTPGKG